MSTLLFTPEEKNFFRFNITDGSPEIAMAYLYDRLCKRTNLNFINSELILDYISPITALSVRYWEYSIDDFTISLNGLSNDSDLDGSYLWTDLVSVHDNGTLILNSEEQFLFTLTRRILKDKQGLLADFRGFVSTFKVNLQSLYFLSLFYRFLNLLDSRANLPPEYREIYTIINDLYRRYSSVVISLIKFFTNTLILKRASFTRLSMSGIHSVTDYEAFIKDIRDNNSDCRIIIEILDEIQ